jgi:hypothetical protein
MLALAAHLSTWTESPLRMARGSVKRRRDPATKPARHSEPRPETAIDWLVWLGLWPVVTVAWLVTVPFVLLNVAVGFALEVLFGSRLRRSDDSNRSDWRG